MTAQEGMGIGLAGGRGDGVSLGRGLGDSLGVGVAISVGVGLVAAVGDEPQPATTSKTITAPTAPLIRE
jgi:hypothetical protein